MTGKEKRELLGIAHTNARTTKCNLFFGDHVAQSRARLPSRLNTLRNKGC